MIDGSNTLKTAEADGIKKTGIEIKADGIERTVFIDGDGETRNSLDNEDIQEVLKELSREITEANTNLEEVTGFYYDLDNFIRSQNVGGAGLLTEGETSDSWSGNHRLCFEDIPDPDAVGNYKYSCTFWRIGYCKVGNTGHLAALRYKINPIEGPKPQHERMGDPIRLTHAPREVRLQAAHHIRALLMLILENVKYSKHVSESAVQKITPLRKSVRAHIDGEEPQ